MPTFLRAAVFALVVAITPSVCLGAETATPSRYEIRQNHDPNGTGKFYCGREIALVMGHEAASWLERPERNQEENTELLIASLDLKPGDVVADIGAGTGYLSRRLAAKVAPAGKVIAQDIQPEMLQLLLTNAANAGITNILTVLGGEKDPRLPRKTVDMAILVDVYHEFEFPSEMMRGICDALKPNGRVVFVEFRAEDPEVPIKAVHKMSEAQVKKEMERVALRHLVTKEVLPWQHIIIFTKQTK